MSSTENDPPLLLGTRMPDVDAWSDRVIVALGQNPSAFTGPGTNTYLVGTGSERILLDTGHGVNEYLPFLDAALERAGCTIQEIVLTHGHPDHIGGAAQIMERHGELRVSKHPWPEIDVVYPFEIHPLSDGDVIETEGATLRGIFTPGHAPDHICFVLEEERSIFTGDNVLGIGTTVIPAETGDLSLYMGSLHRLLEEAPTRLYPAHGPVIEDGPAKLREYIDHRNEREQQILDALAAGVDEIHAMVKIIYAAYPEHLHAPAGQSVGSHLLKLEAEGRVTRDGPADATPISVRWRSA
jgi:glyoxylase-like metal-dependent hydrolase (beta-lactamase superfamily II)